jgi:hypothetical protein
MWILMDVPVAIMMPLWSAILTPNNSFSVVRFSNSLMTVPHAIDLFEVPPQTEMPLPIELDRS